MTDKTIEEYPKYLYRDGDVKKDTVLVGNEEIEADQAKLGFVPAGESVPVKDPLPVPEPKVAKMKNNAAKDAPVEDRKTAAQRADDAKAADDQKPATPDAGPTIRTGTSDTYAAPAAASAPATTSGTWETRTGAAPN